MLLLQNNHLIFSWQINQWQQLWRTRQAKRMPHALIFAGIEGIGKTQFTEHFVRSLLCRQVTDEGYACYACHDCRLIKNKTHPNLSWLAEETTIKIDQVREINEFIQQSSLKTGFRIVVICHADRMNINAANALLKTLEEPSSHALIVLLSNQSASLPATIISRCQRILFNRPSLETGLNFLKSQLTETKIDLKLLLQLAHGAPLSALRLAQEDFLSIRQLLFDALTSLSKQQIDPIKIAAKLQNNFVQVLDFLLNWLIDIIRLQLGEGESIIINNDYAKHLLQLKIQTSLQNNIQFMLDIQKMRQYIVAGINLNKQLMVENLLIRYLDNIAVA